MSFTCRSPYDCTNEVANFAHMCFDCATRSATEWADSKKDRKRPNTKPLDPANKTRVRKRKEQPQEQAELF
jgi:hypothetical protein